MVVGVGALLVIATSPVKKIDPVTGSPPPPAVAHVDPAENCNLLSAHPSDKTRSSAGIADDQLAPGKAIPACEAAVAAHPTDATLLFQLGRVLWSGGRYPDAVIRFADAADRGHAGAMKYLGDAYVGGQGLPPGVQPNMIEASNWYRKASTGDYADAATALAETERQIRLNRFDPSMFQNGKLMGELYAGDFAKAEAPIALAYYAKGVLAGLDANETVFMDPSCKAMIGKLGSQVVDIGIFVSYIAQFKDAGKSVDDAAKSAVVTGLSYIGQDYLIDQGKRDATVLWNEETLGCSSGVTKKVVANIMVTSSNNRAF